MKLITFALLVVVPNIIFGQRVFTGEKSVSVTVGVGDGNNYKGNSDYSSYFGNITYSKTNRNKTRWVIGANSNIRSYLLLGDWARSKAYTADLGLYIPVLMNYKRSWIFSFGFGANAGYEYINSRSMQLFLDGKRQKVESELLYGGFGSLQNEIYITNRIIWLLDCKLRYFKGSDISKPFQWNFGTGIKFRLRN